MGFLPRPKTVEDLKFSQGLSYDYPFLHPMFRRVQHTTMSLTSCIVWNQITLAKFFLKCGYASVQETVQSCWSLLHLAAMLNRPEFIDWLISEGLDVNSLGGDLKMTPLHEAVRAGNLEAATALPEHGADLEARCVGGHAWGASTPLDICLLNKDTPELLNLLLEKGAEYGMNRHDDRGNLGARLSSPMMNNV